MTTPADTTSRPISHTFRWPIVILCAVLVIVLMAYARGPNHHHGNDIGTHGTRVVIIVPH